MIFDRCANVVRLWCASTIYMKHFIIIEIWRNSLYGIAARGHLIVIIQFIFVFYFAPQNWTKFSHTQSQLGLWSKSDYWFWFIKIILKIIIKNQVLFFLQKKKLEVNHFIQLGFHHFHQNTFYAWPKLCTKKFRVRIFTWEVIVNKYW